MGPVTFGTRSHAMLRVCIIIQSMQRFFKDGIRLLDMVVKMASSAYPSFVKELTLQVHTKNTNERTNEQTNECFKDLWARS